MSGSRRAVFLDRDGTLNTEVDFLRSADELALLPGVGAAIARLNDAGWFAVVVTNQSGLARGLLDEAELERIHGRLRAELASSGARLDAIYHCPHHPTQGEPPLRRACGCRKPAPGMLERAARELDLDLARSWIVGDSARDLEAGRRAGARALLVGTGKGERTRAELDARGDAYELVPDLAAAVDRVVADGRQGR